MAAHDAGRHSVPAAPLRQTPRRHDGRSGFAMNPRDVDTTSTPRQHNVDFDRHHEDTTIRYDTRRYFNVRSKADMNRLNLPHGDYN